LYKNCSYRGSPVITDPEQEQIKIAALLNFSEPLTHIAKINSLCHYAQMTPFACNFSTRGLFTWHFPQLLSEKTPDEKNVGAVSRLAVFMSTSVG
jgi:DNA-directed RNA polymerase beta subunit